MRVDAPDAEEVCFSCFLLLVPISYTQMQKVLEHVARKAPAAFDLPPEVSEKIIADSGGNLRKAILVLEALKMQSCVFFFLFSLRCSYFMA
jgi:hypothetical protein